MVLENETDGKIIDETEHIREHLHQYPLRILLIRWFPFVCTFIDRHSF